MASIFDLFKQIEQPSQSGNSNMPITHIVAGLGNPGEKYENTRHNCGFMVMEYLSQKDNIKIDRAKFSSLTAETVISGKRVLLMKPQTLMNRSGEAVAAAASFYKIPTENIIIIHDDISLPAGKLRIKRKGSHGGHNGIRDIIEKLSSEDFVRVKLGVGSPADSSEMISWVLGTFPPADREKMFSAIEKSYEAIGELVKGDIDNAMNKFNR